MQGMFLAAITEFIEFEPIRVVAAILFRRVITLLAIQASEINYLTNVLLCHFSLLSHSGVEH
jgi:hypothetical protein